MKKPIHKKIIINFYYTIQKNFYPKIRLAILCSDCLNKNTVGLYISSGVIIVSNNQSLKQLLETFAHEMAHAIEDQINNRNGSHNKYFHKLNHTMQELMLCMYYQRKK